MTTRTQLTHEFQILRTGPSEYRFSFFNPVTRTICDVPMTRREVAIFQVLASQISERVEKDYSAAACGPDIH
ncbi:MAG: hypothetical protein M0Z99_34575 [Betaproteobacteria bacterium]|nr:hypothetical protein [Betaproteobacteria bacterium]